MTHQFQFSDTIGSEPPENRIVGCRLQNGLTVVMMKNRSIPVVAVDLWYEVGSRNEEQGKSGFAHLFEHMMFEGSENVEKSQHMRLINDVGGIVNGSTTQDRTNYWEVVPSNQLELALWLEADRMRSLNLTQENFDNQRDTVKEERRLRIDNQPYMKVIFELKDEIAYSNYAYKHSVIGSMADLDNASLEDVRNFHSTYYRPNNAILSVVGDIEVNRALELVRKYFEDIPAGPIVPPVNLKEPLQQKEKRTVYEDPFAPFPAYLSAYHIPERTHPDYYPIQLLEKILFDGESSRLYRSLIEEQQMALNIFGGEDGKFGPGLFFHFIQIRPGHTLPEVEAAVQTQIQNLVEHPVSKAELEKTKNKVKADFISRQETVQNKADQLCIYTMLFGNPELFQTEFEKYESLQVEDVRAAAQTYFVPGNRSVIEVYPKNQTIQQAG